MQFGLTGPCRGGAYAIKLTELTDVHTQGLYHERSERLSCELKMAKLIKMFHVEGKKKAQADMYDDSNLGSRRIPENCDEDFVRSRFSNRA